jgi:rubrerythrin
MKKEIKSWKNLEGAFAGESMAYQKYLYFAKLARKKGNEDVAKLFEETAKHEIAHAEGHLRFLYPEDQLSVADLLNIAIKGETFEYTEMYPQYEKTAIEEGQHNWAQESREQIEESRVHAKGFEQQLQKVSKIFGGLAKVEKVHAQGYENALAALK